MGESNDRHGRGHHFADRHGGAGNGGAGARYYQLPGRVPSRNGDRSSSAFYPRQLEGETGSGTACGLQALRRGVEGNRRLPDGRRRTSREYEYRMDDWLLRTTVAVTTPE